MAERMNATEFGALMNRFFREASDVLVDSDAYVDNTAGDQVFGIYLPVFAGADHASRAVEAALEIVRVTEAGGERWVPVGAGVHTGTAYFGTVESGGDFADMTALGDTVNVAARLSSAAKAGEVLATNAICKAAGLDVRKLERRQLRLKGKSKPIAVRVLRTPEP
jgi:adenylate cyclase